MAKAAAIFDLDRTLIAGSSAPVFQRHLHAAGLTSVAEIPLSDMFYSFYTRFGENWFMMQPAKLGGRASKGWSVETLRDAAEDAADELIDLVQPFVPAVLKEHRDAGRLLVLATTSPDPFVRPFAEAMGFHDVVATRWQTDGSTYAGRLDGPFLWGRGKFDAVRAWAADHGVDLHRSYAYSDSYFDAPLLAGVGNPVAVNPDLQLQALAALRRWPIRYFDKPEGVPKILGREIQDWGRPFMRPELVGIAKFSFEGVENIPPEGGVIMVFNHRSYFDPTAVGLLVAKAGRPVRGLGKKEVFDAPVIGRFAKMAGGIRVNRASGSDEPLELAAEALRAGELIMIAPQGTIPRGPAFFEPELKGRWGAARLAQMTGAKVVPVGLWGTEKVWPRSARVPRVNPLRRPRVSVSVGPPVDLGHEDLDADTRAIMAAIVAQLPPEARQGHEPTDDELRLTFPPGYRGDPRAELDRRPGTDT